MATVAAVQPKLHSVGFNFETVYISKTFICMLSHNYSPFIADLGINDLY